jgi:hypothetical protein
LLRKTNGGQKAENSLRFNRFMMWGYRAQRRW